MSEAQETFLKTRIVNLILLVMFTIGIGLGGYIYIEGWSWSDALYMTIITLTTVGFGEIQPLSGWGRIFTVCLIGGGVGIIAYASTTMVQVLVSGELRHQLDHTWRKRMLKKLKDHYIICGVGRMGRYVSDELMKQKLPFVVIDIDEEVVEVCRQQGYQAIVGDAAHAEILKQAGIYRAKSLIATAPSDAANVFIVLTARELDPDLIIVSRVNQDDSVSKLRRAGADEVISPYAIGGQRMVSYIQRPGVLAFLDIVMNSPELALQIEEFVISSNSVLIGQSLRDVELRNKTGVNILAMNFPDQPLSTNLDISVPLECGVHLICLGTSKQLKALVKFF